MRRKRTQIFVSASDRQSKELQRKAFLILDGLGLIGPNDKVSEKEIQTKDIRLVFLPPNPRTIRGFTGDVVLDEFAQLLPGEDKEIWAAVFPMITRGEGELDVASTPMGGKNLFAELRESKRFHQTTITIDDAIRRGSTLDRDLLREECRDEETWRQEYLCEFIDEAAAYLTNDLIKRCVHEGLAWENSGPCSIADDASFYVGMDIGRTHDLTCIWVAGVEDPETDILKSFNIVTMAKARFADQYEVLANILQDERVRRCVIDSTGHLGGLAEKAVEEFGEYRVEALHFTNEIKNKMAGELRRRMQELKIRIPADPKIHLDFHRIRKDVSSHATIRLVADNTRDGHSDRFWAAAMCCWAASSEQRYCQNPIILF